MKIATDLDVRGALTVAGVPIAAGSVILNGTATPTGATGNVGDYYLDTDSGILYGPKVAYGPGESPQYVIIGPSLTSFTSNCMSGMKHRFARAGFVTGVRLYLDVGSVGDGWEVYLFSSAGAILVSKDVSGLTPNAWNTVSFDTPAAVSSGVTYQAAAWTPGTGYLKRQDGAYAGQSSGDVTVLASGVDGPQGTYAGTRDTYPTTAMNAAMGIAAVFVTTPVVEWPVALKSGATLLSDTASPTGATGAAGDYYLETDAGVLYGPKAPGGTPDVSAHTTQTPLTDSSGTPGEKGVRITCAAAGYVTGLRYYRTGYTGQTSRTMKLWVGGVVVASAATTGEAGTGWFTVPLVTAVAVTAGQQVTVSYDYQTSWFPNTPGDPFPIVNGSLTLTISTYGDPGTYPSTNGSQDFFTDIVFNLSPPNPWPVALKSVPAGGTTSQALVKTSATDYATQWSTPAGGGSTILSGTATPGDATGAVGDYYLDTDSGILYGPKNVPPSAVETSIHTTQTPTGNSDYTGAEGGTKITCAAAGYIMALRYYRSTADTGTNTRTMRLWNQSGGTQLAVVTGTIAAGVGWNTLTLTTPVAVAAGAALTVSFTGVGQKGTTGSGLPITNGSLTATAGMYADAPGTYPNNANGTQDAFLDVVFSTTGTTPPPTWPVALKSGATLLSGTATPTAATGALGDYYLDTDDLILYGPKGVSATNYSAITTETGATGYSLNNESRGSDFTFASAGSIVGLRYLRPADATVDLRTMRLWSSGGTEVANGSTTLTGAGWKDVSITPVAVTAGQTFRVSLDVAGSDRATRIYPSLGAVTNGPITLTDQHWQGTPGNRPSSGDTVYFWVDVVFQASGAPSWPVALKSVPAGAGTIISGTATPTSGTGTVGDYYLDEDDRVLYGPKGAPVAGPEYVSPPAAGGASPGPGNVGMKFRFTTTGPVTGVRINIPAGTSVLTGYTVQLWNKSTRVQVPGASKTATVVPGWNNIFFDTPATVVIGQTYVASVFMPSGGQVMSRGTGNTYTGQVSTPGGVVVGLAEGVDGTAASYNFDGTPTYPVDPWGDATVGISPIVGTVTDPWPVALKSVPPGGTTGQVLGKTSGTDYDAGWAAGGGSGGGAADSDQNILGNQIFS